MSNLRVVHFSDTHCTHKDMKIPDGDILIFSGDMSNAGMQWEVENFMKWWTRLPFQYKIIVPGNHDICFDKTKFSGSIPFWTTYLLSQYKMYESINFFLEDEGCSIQGIKIWGSPYSPKVREGQDTRWAFSKDRKDLLYHWDKIPKDTDILITHGPPYGKLDWARPGNTYIGDERLRWYVDEIKPKAHLFGHIHESYGGIKGEHTLFLNGSIVNERYENANDAHVFDIDLDTKKINYINY